MSIHDELERIAARAPEVVVPADTYGRAQRARRRDRALAVAVVVVLVAIGGTLAWLPSRDAIDPADSDSLGVPDRVWSAPARLSERRGDAAASWRSDAVEEDLAIGPGAVAYVTGDGLPIVIGAQDGAYHPLDLPGFIGNDSLVSIATNALGIALSPDGRQLAYAWATIGPAADTDPIPSGIRIVDLTTGARTREVPLRGGEGVLVEDLAFSPDGRWLIWSGAETTSWTSGSLGGRTPVRGLVPPGATESEPLPRVGGSALVSMVVTDTGRVTLLGDARAVVVEGGEVTRTEVVGNGFSLGAGLVGDGVHDLRTDEDRGGFRHLRYSDTEPAGVAERLPDLGRRDAVVPLAWADDEHLLARVDRRGEPPSELALIGTGAQPSYDVVGSVDAGVPELHVATGLVTAARPVVERPEPDWPTDWEAVATKVAWIAVPGAFLLMLVLPWLRRRLSAGGPTRGPAAH